MRMVGDLVVLDADECIVIASRDAISAMTPFINAAEGSHDLHRRISQGGHTVSDGLDQLRPRPAVVTKPWGREIWWAETEYYAAKRLDITAGGALSLQYHKKKHETLYVLTGEARITLDETTLVLGPGDVVAIPPGTKHRLEATTPTVIFEVSTPHLDDVIRLDDRYGRATAAPRTEQTQ